MTAVFDGHNDALTRDDADDFATGRKGGHLDVPRARAGGLAGGIFAAFTPTPGYSGTIKGQSGGAYEVPLAPAVDHEIAAELVDAVLDRLDVLQRDGHVRVVRSIGDLDTARDDGVLAAVAHIEGAEAVDPGLEALDALYARGLRSVGVVWSRPNVFAHGVPFAFPASPD